MKAPAVFSIAVTALGLSGLRAAIIRETMRLEDLATGL